MTVGERIKAVRLMLGLTMEQFGEKLDTSKGAVNNWEKSVNLPNKSRLTKMANLGNITVDYILYGDSNITISKEEYEELLEFKNRYEQLCK